MRNCLASIVSPLSSKSGSQNCVSRPLPSMVEAHINIRSYISRTASVAPVAEWLISKGCNIYGDDLHTATLYHLRYIILMTTSSCGAIMNNATLLSSLRHHRQFFSSLCSLSRWPLCFFHKVPRCRETEPDRAGSAKPAATTGRPRAASLLQLIAVIAA